MVQGKVRARTWAHATVPVQVRARMRIHAPVSLLVRSRRRAHAQACGPTSRALPMPAGQATRSSPALAAWTTLPHE